MSKKNISNPLSKKVLSQSEFKRLLNQEYIPPRRVSPPKTLSDVDKLVNYNEFVSFFFLTFGGIHVTKHPIHNVPDYSNVLTDSEKALANDGITDTIKQSSIYKTLLKKREEGLRASYEVLLGNPTTETAEQQPKKPMFPAMSMSDPNRDAYIGSVRGGVYSKPVSRGNWKWRAKAGLPFSRLHVAFEEYFSSLPREIQNQIVITSTTGDKHASRSYHYVSMAVDISCKVGGADDLVNAIFTDPLLARFGLWTLDPNHGTAPHIHLEYRGSRNEFASYTASNHSFPSMGSLSASVMAKFRGAQHGMRSRSTLRDDLLKDASFSRSGVDGSSSYGSGGSLYGDSEPLDDGSFGRTTYSSSNPWSGAKLVAKPLTKKKGGEEALLSFFGKEVGSDAPPSLYVLSEHEIVLDAMSVDGDGASYDNKDE